MAAVRPDAKILPRAVAAGTDYVLLALFVFGMTKLFGVPDEKGELTLGNAQMLVVVIVWFIYFPFIESFHGQTLGKRIFSLRVVTTSGQKLSLKNTLIRHLLDPMDFGGCGLVGILIFFVSGQRQRLGDMAANTFVIGHEIVTCAHCQTPVEVGSGDLVRDEFRCVLCGTYNVFADGDWRVK